MLKNYNTGAYNKYNETEQWIRITEGCPNNCEFCYETKINGSDPIYYEIPEIVRNTVKIMDMNLLSKPRAIEIINKLGSIRVNKKVVYYELVCGIDWRFLTLELALALKKARFVNIRFAWDFGMGFQKEIKNTVNLLRTAGYKKNITVFMICNWKIPYKVCLMKLDLCKVWNVKVADCYFDNQVSPNIKPIYWTEEQIKKFRKKVRKHNQLILFGIDPEFKSTSKNDRNLTNYGK